MNSGLNAKMQNSEGSTLLQMSEEIRKKAKEIIKNTIGRKMKEVGQKQKVKSKINRQKFESKS